MGRETGSEKIVQLQKEKAHQGKFGKPRFVFQDRCLKPLGHPSKPMISSA
jgi:hypothetical protein